MKTIPRQLIPKDFSYYRTGSRVFYEYYRRYSRNIIHRVGEGFSFLKMGKIFGLPIYSIIAEKIDIEPSIDDLGKLGVHHGIIYWGPMRTLEKPKGWIRMPAFLLQYFEFLHSTRSAFSVLDRPDYWEKWSPKARAHRRKVLQDQEQGIVEIRQIFSLAEYLNIYKDIRVPDPHKSYLTALCHRFSEMNLDSFRMYLVYIGGVPLAGGIFIDEGVTSEYFTSFYAQESHPYHPGIALLDRWFLDSSRKGIRYCDLDHMRDSWQSTGYAGYTKFKESIADYDVYFHDMWIKIF